MSGRRITRRQALAFGGAAAATGIVGAMTVRWLDERRVVFSTQLPQEPPYRSPELAARLPAGFTHITDAFEGREFAPGQPIDLPEGIFFLQQDGRVEAIHAKTSLAFQWPIPPGTPPNFGWSPGPWDDPGYVAPVATYESLCDGEIIRAEVWHHREKTKQFAFLHRNSGAAFTIGEPDLMLWPAGPYLVMVSTAHLDYSNPIKRPDGFIPLKFKVLDGGLNLVNEGTMLTSAQRGRPSENSLAYDRRSGYLYYFEPADDWKRLVRLNVRGKRDPEDVLQLPEMTEARDISGTTSNWDIWPSPDQRTVVGIDRTTQSAWLIRDSAPVVRSRGIFDSWEFAQLSPDGSAFASRDSLRGFDCVTIRDTASGEPLLRVRSATLHAREFRWMVNGGLALDTLDAPSAVLAFTPKAANLTRSALADPQGAGRIPSARSPGLVALGLFSMEIAPGNVVTASVEPTLLDSLRTANLLRISPPWSGRPHEMQFTFPGLPGGYNEFPISTERGRLFLPPVVEFAPYTDDAVFTASQSYDLRDGAYAEAATVAHIDAGERLELVPNPREEWPKMELAEWGERPGITWAHVAASPTRYGWIPVELLRWATGTPL